MVGVNLIPTEVSLRQAQRIRLVRWSGVLAIGLSVLGVALGIDLQRSAEASDLRVEEDRTQQDLVGARTRLRALTSDLVRVENQVEHARALRTKRAWSGIMALVARCLPDQCWLTSISTDPEKPSRASPAVKRAPNAPAPEGVTDVVVIDAPRRLRIIGFAQEPSAPNTFVQRLQQESVFSDVDLTNSHEEPILNGIYHRFDVVCEW